MGATIRRIFLLSRATVVWIVLLSSECRTQQSWFWQNPLPRGNHLRAVQTISINLTVAVGDQGTVLRSTDGGASWNVQSTGVATNLYGLAFIDAYTGVVVGDTGTVLRTTDGGSSWALLTGLDWTQSGGTKYALRGAAFVNSSTGTIVGDGGTIFRTIDGGNTWSFQFGTGRYSLNSVSFSSSVNGSIAGSSGTVLRTSNGGLKWNRQYVPPEFDNRTFYGSSFPDPLNGTVVGDLGTIIRTTDGGATWTSQTSGTMNRLSAVSFSDAKTGTIVGESGIIFRTTDGGANWILQPGGTDSWFTGISFTNASIGTIVGSYGVVYRTTDGGATWVLQTPGTRIPLYAVRFTDAMSGTVVGYKGAILRTTDGGGTWSPQVSGATTELQGIAFADVNTASAVGWNNTILRTTNAGTTWSNQTIKTTGVVLWFSGVSFGNSRNGLIVGKRDTMISPQLTETWSIVLRTTNGGAGWYRSGFAKKDRWLYAVAFCDTNTAFAVGDSGAILRSSDGGQGWIPQSGIWPRDYASEYGIVSVTGVRLLAVSFVDTSRGIVAGDSGVILRTTNGGSTWTKQVSGTTNTLRGVWLADANTGIAVGDSMTILRTSDGGLTWATVLAGTNTTLCAVSFADAKNGTIVGEGGTILRTSSGVSAVTIDREGGSSPPLSLSLEQNYPNPFNPTTNFEFRISPACQSGGDFSAKGGSASGGGFVSLKVFDILGREVATLVNEELKPGKYMVRWDGSALPSGVYFCRLTAGSASTGSAQSFVDTKKMVLMK